MTRWPELSYASWRETCTALHLWTQIAGKFRLAYTPWVNHSWHVTLYVTPRGLTTSSIADGERSFELLFDFVRSTLRVETGEGTERSIALAPRSVADFYEELRSVLAELGFRRRIYERPNEVLEAVPFSQDRTPRAYSAEDALRFFRVLSQVDRVFKQFRTAFLGKVSPVHFFWGSFDLAVTRFSGRSAPPHPGGVPNLPDAIAREAYSHEVSSAGFWPGDAGHDASFYSYAYPQPPGYREHPVRPAEAGWDAQLSEFVLPYAVVQRAQNPDAVLLDFLQSTYAAAADSARWDRAELECNLGVPRVPRSL